MPKVTFKDKDNNVIETIEVPENTTDMEAARFHSKNEYIEGIDAVCGGGSVCGTCHVHVDENWIDKVTPKDENDIEQAILDYVDNYDDKHSRLSCQLILYNEHDGLEVKIP